VKVRLFLFFGHWANNCTLLMPLQNG
jgi:hypothetical protein